MESCRMCWLLWVTGWVTGLSGLCAHSLTGEEAGPQPGAICMSFQCRFVSPRRSCDNPRYERQA